MLSQRGEPNTTANKLTSANLTLVIANCSKKSCPISSSMQIFAWSPALGTYCRDIASIHSRQCYCRKVAPHTRSRAGFTGAVRNIVSLAHPSAQLLLHRLQLLTLGSGRYHLLQYSDRKAPGPSATERHVPQHDAQASPTMHTVSSS